MARNKSTRISRGAAADTVSAVLRSQILKGELAEGEPLRQDSIAERFNTSRVPVREALRQLEAEGLVTFHPRRGACVTALEPADVLEMFDIRLALEAHALRLAVPNMTHADFDTAEAYMRRYNKRMTPSLWDEINWGFHSTLYLPAHRPRLFRLIKNNYFHAARFLRVRIALATGYEKPHKEHGQILEACRKGDVQEAVRLLEAHIDGTRKQLATQLQRAILSA